MRVLIPGNIYYIHTCDNHNISHNKNEIQSNFVACAYLFDEALILAGDQVIVQRARFAHKPHRIAQPRIADGDAVALRLAAGDGQHAEGGGSSVQAGFCGEWNGVVVLLLCDVMFWLP